MEEDNLDREVETLKEDIAKLSGDIADVLRVLQRLGAGKIDAARESLDGEAEKYGEDIRQAFQGAKARGESAAENLETEIALHPLRSVLVAFGVGYVVAKLMRGK